VETFDLDVEYGIYADLDVEVVLDVFGEPDLAQTLDLHEAALEVLVLCEGLELFQLFEVGYPTVAYLGIDKLGESGIGLEKPSALGDAVRFVVELFGVEVVPVLEDVGAQEVGVKLGDAVDE
jgi:hypothetical protein